MKNTFLLSLLACSLTACVTVSPVYQAPPEKYRMVSTLDEQTASKVMEHGSATIKGQSFLRQNGGGIVTCAGKSVSLIPATDYAREYLEARYGHNVYSGIASVYRTRQQHEFEGVNMNFQRYQRKTICDATGNFGFKNVPAGSYYVTTHVEWQVRTSQGGHMATQVMVSENEQKDLIITR